MRTLILTAIFTLSLLSCGNKMQQIQTAGDKMKQCLNNCSLSMPSVSSDKKSSGNGCTEAVSADKSGGSAEREPGIWANHLNLW